MPDSGKRGFQRCALAKVSIAATGQCNQNRLFAIGPNLNLLASGLRANFSDGTAEFINSCTLTFQCEALGRRSYDFTPSLKWCRSCCIAAGAAPPKSMKAVGGGPDAEIANPAKRMKLSWESTALLHKPVPAPPPDAASCGATKSAHLDGCAVASGAAIEQRPTSVAARDELPVQAAGRGLKRSGLEWMEQLQPEQLQPQPTQARPSRRSSREIIVKTDSYDSLASADASEAPLSATSLDSDLSTFAIMRSLADVPSMAQSGMVQAPGPLEVQGSSSTTSTSMSGGSSVRGRSESPTRWEETTKSHPARGPGLSVDLGAVKMPVVPGLQLQRSNSECSTLSWNWVLDGTDNDNDNDLGLPSMFDPINAA